MIRTIPTLLLAPSTFTVLAPVASSQVMLNQAPSQTFSLQAEANAGSLADNFVVSAAGGMDLKDVRWWGGWGSAGPNSGLLQPDTFDVYIHQSLTGPAPFFYEKPGVVVASFLGLVPNVVATGINFPTQFGLIPEFQLDLTLPSSVPLLPGAYWIELFSTDSSGTIELFIWEMAPLDTTHGASCTSWAPQTPGIAWNSCTPFPATDMALLLQGVPSGPPGSADCDCTAANGPCFNVGGAGRGCPNSNANGLGAKLTGAGVASIAFDTFSLTVTDAAPSAAGLILSGTSSLGPNGLGTLANSAGILCVSGSTIRGSVVVTDASGFATFPNFLGAPYGAAGIVVSGSPVSYTYWFRDPGTAAGCIGDTASSDFNFSNGWTVVWSQ